jgi:putative peptidoglycan lipid II flippase
MKDTKGGLIKSTILITFCSVIGIAVSFISQLIIAYYFGAKFERDAYFVANTIPVYLSAIFTGSIGIVFLPKIVDLINNNPTKVSDFLSTVLWTLIIITSLLGGLCILFSHKVISIVASGFDINQNLFASKILIIIIPTFVLSVLTNLLSSLYQIQHKFLRPALAPIFNSTISLIFVIILSYKIGIFGLAIGFLSGSIISFIYLLPILRTFKLKIRINLTSPEIILFIKSIIPLFLTGILFRSTNIFERTIASNLQDGSISYLGYTSQVLTILATLTSTGIGVSIYPTLSRLWSENKVQEFNQFFSRTIRIIILISIPISLSVIFFGDIFIKILFERGAFTHNVTIAVGKALAWSMGAFIFQNLGNVVTKIFYISGKTTLISIIATLELILYISFGYFMSTYLSFIGLSIALSLSSMSNILLSFFFIKKKIIKIQIKSILMDIGKILVVSLISILIVYVLYSVCSEKDFYIIIFAIPGLIIFYILGLIFNIEEFIYIKELSKKFNFNNYGRRNKTQ